MFTAAVRDLVWRRKRFGISLVAIALVMSMSLVMSGLSASFTAEVDRLLDALGGEVYLAADGANGPFNPGAVVNSNETPAGASAVLSAGATVLSEGEILQVTVFGVEPGQLGDPVASSGELSVQPVGVVVSSELGLNVGETVELGGRTYEILAETDGLTLYGGQPTIFLPLAEVQQVFLAGQPAATFFLAPAGTGTPAGLTSFDRGDAKDELIRPMLAARDSITFVTLLLWIVAACIVGSVVFLSALERTRDFAVFKATGTSTGSIAGGLMLQAALLAAAASLVAIVIALLIAPSFPMPVEISTASQIQLPILAVVVGLLASLVGLRRVLSVPPSLAFGGAT